MLPCSKKLLANPKLLDVKQLVMKTLHHDPKSRPTFDDCQEALESIVQNLSFEERHNGEVVGTCDDPSAV